MSGADSAAGMRGGIDWTVAEIAAKAQRLVDALTERGQPAIRGGAVVVKVPASSANLGPGFDSLGMALSLFARIAMRPADETRITLVGDNLDGIPTDRSNLVYEVAQSVFQAAGIEMPELDIVIGSDIPLTRGLGSSASAIVGALVAANALAGNALDDDELFRMATALENHPDNVGASLFGGIVVAAWDGERVSHVRLDPPPRLEALALIPMFELSTKKARAILPQSMPLADAVFNVSHSSLLTAALATGRLDLLRHAMRDRIHQPYRAPLIPGMEQILREAADHGALGAALSGAGPTLLMLMEADSPRLPELEAYLEATMKREGVPAALLRLQLCASGPTVEWLDEDGVRAMIREPGSALAQAEAEVGA